MATQALLKAEEIHHKLAAAYAPIAADLEAAERIFEAELASRFPFVQSLVGHCSDFRGKRLRPALVLLSGQSLRRHDLGPSGPRRRRRDDPHRDTRS